MRGDLLEPLALEYQKRMTLWPVRLCEWTQKDFEAFQKTGHERTKHHVRIILDAGGRDYSSPAFFAFMEKQRDQGGQISFFIGQANGFPKGFSELCDHSIAFGSSTWPHLLARVLLLEQLYRAQQRASNHPYSFI